MKAKHSTTNPRTLKEHQIARNMAQIALRAMKPGDERIPVARERLRKAEEGLRVFKYKAKGCLTPSGKLLRV